MVQSPHRPTSTPNRSVPSSGVAISLPVIHRSRHTPTISMKKAISILLAPLVVWGVACADDDLWESKGPHVRIKRNDQDGSYVVFERSPDDRRLVKTTKNQNGQVKMRATYKRNEKGFLTFGQIHDGQGTLIYRVQYGYDKKTGRLIAEQMFDARVKNYYPLWYTDPETGKKVKVVDPETGERVEMPVRRVYYFYDAEGNQSRALSLVPMDGQKAEEAFRRTGKTLSLYGEEDEFDASKSTRGDLNPFDQEKRKQEQ